MSNHVKITGSKKILKIGDFMGAGTILIWYLTFAATGSCIVPLGAGDRKTPSHSYVCSHFDWLYAIDWAKGVHTAHWGWRTIGPWWHIFHRLVGSKFTLRRSDYQFRWLQCIVVLARLQKSCNSWPIKFALSTCELVCTLVSTFPICANFHHLPQDSYLSLLC